MSCLNIKPSQVMSASQKFYIQKQEGKKEENQLYYRDYFQIYYVVQGYLTVTDKEGEIHLGIGDIAILPPAVNYTVSTNTKGAKYYLCLFSIDFIDAILQHQAGTSGVLSKLFNAERMLLINPIPADTQIHLSNMMDFLIFEYTTHPINERLAVQNCLATVFCIFSDLLQKNFENENTFTKNSILQVISYVKKNYNMPLSLETVIKLSHMTKKEFCERFKSFSGYTFNAFLNKYRIERAVEIIKKTSGNISLNNLYSICGYETYVTFYRNFIKYTAMTPAECVALYSVQN